MKENTNNPRAEIDVIDDALLRLLNKRFEIALRVGEVKRRQDVSLCDPNREREVLERLCRENSGPLNALNITSIFQRIIDECLHVQQQAFHTSTADVNNAEMRSGNFSGKGRAAFLGERGTFQ